MGPHVNHVNDILKNPRPIWYWEVSRLGFGRLSGKGQVVKYFQLCSQTVAWVGGWGLSFPIYKKG